MATGITVHVAVSRAIQAAREDGRLKPWHEPAAAVALKLAKALTPAKLASTELVRLSNELDKQLSRLPLAETTTSDGGPAGDGTGSTAGGASESSPRPAGLAPGVGAGPEVGDTSLP
jgi:hypothetical protein